MTTNNEADEELGRLLKKRVIESSTVEELLDALQERGRIVEVATRSGPEESWFYGSDGAQRCLSCRFFALTSNYKSGGGTCRIRAPGANGFPEVRAAHWCGEFKARLATQPRYNEPPIDAPVDVTPHLLKALDDLRQKIDQYMRSAKEYGLHRVQWGVRDAEIMLSLIDRAQKCGLSPERAAALQAALENGADRELPCITQAVFDTLKGDDESLLDETQ